MNKKQLGFVSRGYFSGEYVVDLSAYEGPDFSRRCLVFPGQSAAYPGMMKQEILGSEAALSRFRQADELASALDLAPVSAYVQMPERLSAADLRALRNPALFTLEVALFDHLLAKGLKPAAVTGHSFGEYAAVVASGLARFQDVFELVVRRDRVSPPAYKTGLMIVANASQEDVARALGDMEFHLCNFNSPKQIVFAVRPAIEAKAHSTLRAARIAAKTLNEMDHPYHTPWMEPVSRELATFLANARFEFSVPRIPLISSVGAELITTGERAATELRLARQVCEPVVFPRQIQRALELGAINFMEVGPGELCSQFVISTLGESFYKITPLTKFVAAAAAPKEKPKAKSEKSHLLGALGKVIAAVTGYSIDEISVEQNFQEDLGIDSIRKAEIVFKFMESMNEASGSNDLLQVNLSQVKRIEDLLQHLETRMTSSPAREVRPPRFERYEPIYEPAPITDFDRLNSVDRDFEAMRVVDLAACAAEDLAWLRSRPTGATICFVAPSLEPTAAREGSSESVDPQQLFNSRLRPWLAAFRAIATVGERWPARVALALEPACDPYLAGLDGFFKSWLKENGFEAYKRIELDHALRGAALATLVEEEFLDHRHVEVRYDGDKRLALRWARREPQTTSRILPSLAPVIFSIGGGRGIGAAILERTLRALPSAHVYVVGRSDANHEKTAATLEKLRQLGTHVVYVQADATDSSQLREALTRVAREHGRIDVVLNGAGVEMSRSFGAKSEAEIAQEFQGKVAPVAEICRVMGTLEIGHLINYSSVAATFGNTGQTIYALGNQIQVALSERAAKSSAGYPTRVTSLVLPPWENLGMTENEVILKGLKSTGVALLPKERGVELVFDELLHGAESACAQVAFLDRNDLRAYDAELSNRRAHEALFSRPISTGQPIKMPSLNRRDQTYLNDHVINGTVIYPGSSALALMFYVGYLYFKRTPRIENFEVKCFLQPELEGSSAELEIESIADDRLRLRLFSKRVVHFVAEVVVESALPAASTDIAAGTTGGAGKSAAETPKLGPFTIAKKIGAVPLYGNEHINLGRHFQHASTLWFNENEELLQISSETHLTRYTPVIGFDRLQQWFESALQVMGSQLLHQTKKFWVPNRIGCVRAWFGRALTPELQYRVKVHSVTDEHAVATTYAMNAQGEILFELSQAEDITVGRDESGRNFELQSTSGGFAHV